MAPDQVAREVPKASGVSIGIPSRPDSPVNETDTEYASTSRGRRTTSDVRYTKDGNLAAVHMLQPLSDLDMYCPYQDLAHTILEDRQRRVNLITGDPSRVHVDHDNVYEVVDLSTYLLDIESSALSRQSMVVAIAGGHTVPIHLDTTLAHTWHEPANEREYNRSPQRPLWRTAQELKMDIYKSKPVFQLVSVAWVKSMGYVIMNSIWVRTIKLTGAGTFNKLNPRWCLVGTGMDRDLYESYAEVCLWSTVLLLVQIGTHYEVVGFDADISDAFQSTVRATSTDAGKKAIPLFCYQAPGHAEYGPNGDPLCCELLAALQGGIDSTRLFDTAFGRTLLKRAHCRPALWDPQACEYHVGPLAASGADLPAILAACASAPPAPGAPVGWAVFARHVDDIKGVANSTATRDFLIGAIGIDWTIRSSGWTTILEDKTEIPNKFLGYNFRMFNDGLMCEISCMAVIESLFQQHSKGKHVINPGHPYPMNVAKLPPGIRPPEGSPELAAFLDTQTRFRAGVGASIWISRAHMTHTYPTNIHCGSMSCPSEEHYKSWFHSLCYIRAHPCPLVIGSGRKASLALPNSPARPFGGQKHRTLGLHAAVDADLGTPTDLERDAMVTPIAEGLLKLNPTWDSKSLTGIDVFLGGVLMLRYVLRQHLTAPSSHASEITAAGTAVTMLIPLSGLLQEWHISSDTPPPIHCDSQSTIFVARRTAAIKRSVWINRRAVVIREAVDALMFTFEKIEGTNNTANGNTKAVTREEFKRHLTYTHPYADFTDAERIVIAATFHAIIAP